MSCMFIANPYSMKSNMWCSIVHGHRWHLCSRWAGRTHKNRKSAFNYAFCRFQLVCLHFREDIGGPENTKWELQEVWRGIWIFLFYYISILLQFVNVYHFFVECSTSSGSFIEVSEIRHQRSSSVLIVVKHCWQRQLPKVSKLTPSMSSVRSCLSCFQFRSGTRASARNIYLILVTREVQAIKLLILRVNYIISFCW
jgi:hypothetical protein